MSIPANEIEAHEKRLQEVLKLYNGDQWKLSKDDKGVKYYTANYENNSFSMVKSVVTIQAPYEKVRGLLMKAEIVDKEHPAPKGDDTKEMYVFDHVDDGHDSEYMYCSYSSGTSLVADREFLALRRHYEVEGKDVWLHCTPLNEKMKDVVPPNVRGYMTFQADILEHDESDKNACKFTFLVHCDPLGKIPAFVYNAVAISQGDAAKKLRERALK